METCEHLRADVDAVLRRRGWPVTGPVEWGFLDRNGILVDATAEDDPSVFLADEIRDLRREVDAMAAERRPAHVKAPSSPTPLASKIQAELEASEPGGDDDSPGLWERARAAAMLFYLERTGKSQPDPPADAASGALPSTDAAAFEIAHPVRVLDVTTVGDWQATTKVTLALDPTLSSAQVAAMWQKVRAGVLRQGARGRTISRKSVTLALFVAHHPGRTWSELRQTWNQLYAHWAFKSPDLRAFRNAAVRTRRYLLEPPVVDDVHAGTWQWMHRQAARLAPGAKSALTDDADAGTAVRLFAVYLGGDLALGRMGEDHEVVHVVAPDPKDARRLAKAKWQGAGHPHVDAVVEIDVVDGFAVCLEPSTRNSTAVIDTTYDPP